MADAGLTHAGWRARVPELLDACREQWGLKLGKAYEPGAAGYAVRAGLPDGTPAVLKLIYPDRETEHEANALELWDGDGAVRLLARDDERSAILIERCEPGTYSSGLGAERALSVLIELLPRLWKPAGPPFRSLSEEAAWWLESLPAKWEAAGRPFERPLLEAALEGMRELAPTQGKLVLVHQDLHADNVLAAEREPWLVIDPKPLAGEREFGIAALVRGGELGFGQRDVRYRFDRLTAELGLDRERTRGWALAQTLAWGFGNGTAHRKHVECARWLVEAD